MDVKKIAKNAYNQSADLWHQSRISSLDKHSDEKLLKQNRPHLFVEKPAMFSKIPNLSGKTVLCLGCGSAEEVTFIKTKCPAKIIGVDISEKLIEIARKDHPDVEFFALDAEKLDFKENTFDFIYCSLMLDYFESWNKVLGNIYRILKPGGIFLFSNLHPVKWAAKTILDEDGKAIGINMGYGKKSDGSQEIYGDYLNTTVHETKWMKNIELSFYTKPISLMFRELVKAGFTITDILEPKAVLDAKNFDRDYWEVNQRIPNFVIFEAKRP